MTSKPMRQAVLVSQTLPAELQELLASYLLRHGQMPFLLAESFEIQGPFCHIDMCKIDGSREHMPVLLPLGHVLAIVPMDDQKAQAMGFLS